MAIKIKMVKGKSGRVSFIKLDETTTIEFKMKDIIKLNKGGVFKKKPMLNVNQDTLFSKSTKRF
jgi:hypothetical protein